MAHPKHHVISEIISRHKPHHPHDSWVEKARCHATDEKANRRSKCTVDVLRDILSSPRSTAAERLEIEAWLREHDPEHARGAAF